MHLRILDHLDKTGGTELQFQGLPASILEKSRSCRPGSTVAKCFCLPRPGTLSVHRSRAHLPFQHECDKFLDHRHGVCASSETSTRSLPSTDRPSELFVGHFQFNRFWTRSSMRSVTDNAGQPRFHLVKGKRLGEVIVAPELRSSAPRSLATSSVMQRI